MGSVIEFHKKPKWLRHVVAVIESPNGRNYNSENLKVSRVQKKRMDASVNLKFHSQMALDRNAIIRRLNLLPSVLGKKNYEIADLIGCSPRDWANWRSSKGSVHIQDYAALELYRVFEISMDWIYGGDLTQIRNQGLRERIAMAEHEKSVKGAEKLQRGAKKLDRAATKLDKAATKLTPAKRKPRKAV